MVSIDIGVTAGCVGCLRAGEHSVLMHPTSQASVRNRSGMRPNLPAHVARSWAATQTVCNCETAKLSYTNDTSSTNCPHSHDVVPARSRRMQMRFATVACALALLVLWTSTATAGTPHVFKHDQFSEDLSSAASQISGIPLPTQPGFAKGEAFGQMYHPTAGMYPVKLTAVELFLAAPPNMADGAAHADIEVWFHDGSTPDPGKATPDFVLSTTDVFDPISGKDGMPLQGNTALAFEFNWDDNEGHPPMLYEGSFTIMVRFKETPKDMQAEWGTYQCTEMANLGMCGCQEVGTINDQATSSKANLLHIIYPPGNCAGAPNKWIYTEDVGVTGDFIMRARAEVTGGGCEPQCGENSCGSDGCDGTCGACESGYICVQGVCEEAGPCVPKCDGKDCGDDGCDGVCGLCDADWVCVAGLCEEEGGPCVPKCDDKDCGDDGCDGACGICDDGWVCVQGVCEEESGPCVPDCDGKDCGDDGCDGVCGLCDADWVCVAGLCEEEGGPCVPKCDDKDCGDDGCDGACGICDDGWVCVQGVCEEESGPCVPDCDGKDCGDDGCEGICGQCSEEETCEEGVCKAKDIVEPGGITIEDMSPSWGYSDTETDVAITGSGFVPGATVMLGGTYLGKVQVPSAQLITASVPAEMEPGLYKLVVMNSDQSTESLADAFEVKERIIEELGDADGCNAGVHGSWPSLVLLALFGLAALALRRKSTCER